MYYVVMVKSTLEISQNVVAFSEYMNFKKNQIFIILFEQDCPEAVVHALSWYSFGVIVTYAFVNLICILLVKVYKRLKFQGQNQYHLVK